MNQTIKEEVIRQYIEAYNHFDIDSMLVLLHPDVRFQNISNDEINAQTVGKPDFEALARQSVALFETRSQSVRSLRIRGNKVIVEIDFIAVLAKDLPNGLKSGQTLALQGKSEFLFKDGLIYSIVDES